MVIVKYAKLEDPKFHLSCPCSIEDYDWQLLLPYIDRLAIIFSVSTYDPDSRFIYNDVIRLEAVMPQDVEIVSSLAELQSKLTTILRVKIPRTSDADIPYKYVVKLISRWSEGYSKIEPTWREFLQKLGLRQLSQSVELCLKGMACSINDGMPL